MAPVSRTNHDRSEQEQVEQLANDGDQSIAGPASELRQNLREQYGALEPPELPHRYGHFGL